MRQAICVGGAVDKRIISERALPGPVIDGSRCSGWGLCVLVCPTHALDMQDALAVVTDPNACNYTGYCELICPHQAITLLYEITHVSKEVKDDAD